MILAHSKISFPITYDSPVLYLLGTHVDTDHIRGCASFISSELTSLSELFLLPQVPNQLLAKLSFRKKIEV
jgi:hypothetical protein